MNWFASLRRKVASARDDHEASVLKCVAEAFADTPTGPLDPARCPMPISLLQDVLLKRATAATGAERVHFCQMFIETGRFQADHAKGARMLEVMFSPGASSSLDDLTTGSALMNLARRKSENDQDALKQALVRKDLMVD